MFNGSNQEFLFSTKSGIVEASSRQSTPPFKHFLDSSRRFDLDKHFFFACKISKEHLKTKKLLTFYISRCKRILLTNSCHWSLTSRAQKKTSRSERRRKIKRRDTKEPVIRTHQAIVIRHLATQWLSTNISSSLFPLHSSATIASATWKIVSKYHKIDHLLRGIVDGTEYL